MKILLSLTLLLATQITLADYRSELYSSYSLSSHDDEYTFSDVFDVRNDTESQAFNTGAIVYFKPVLTQAVPLAEAAFLSKASNMSLHYSISEIDMESSFRIVGESWPSNKNKSTSDSEDLSVNFNYIFDQQGWLLGIAISKSESDTAFEFGGLPMKSSSKAQSWGLTAGKYITDTSLLTFAYYKGEADLYSDIYDKSNVDSDAFSVAYKQLFYLANSDHIALNLSASKGESENELHEERSNKFFSAGLSWYPITALSIGGALDINKSENSEARGIGLMSEYFFTEMIAAHLMTTKLTTDYDNNDLPETDIMEYQLGARLRF
ncbi:MAG: hypothetical protein HRU20_06525 [Pseudomonadales bacterium]|nr:hypothetical protein [Pseudomonadales bacterium]